MTIRFKIAAAALGLVLATGLASAQTGTKTQTAPVAAQTQTDTGVKAPAKVIKIAHKTHRVRVSHRAINQVKVAHRSLRSKLAHKVGSKHFVKAPVATKHLAKTRLVGTQKHAINTMQINKTVIR